LVEQDIVCEHARTTGAQRLRERRGHFTKSQKADDGQFALLFLV